MKRLINKIFNFIFCDIALYVYFSLSISGILCLSLYQLKKEYDLVPAGVQWEFRPYVRNFIKESQKHTLPNEFGERLEHLTVKYGFPSRLADEHDFAGWCDLDTTTIIIEKDTWNSYAEGSRQSLIDHELGHCLLERSHRPFLAEGNTPISIMFPQVLPSKFYEENKDKLYPELFQYSRSNKIRHEIQVFNNTWNQQKMDQFKTVAQYLRFIESHINGDVYQPWPDKPKPKPQVIQFDTADVMVITPRENARQAK